MKVLIKQDNVVGGFARSFLKLGFEVFWWPPKVAEFDIFDEVEPQIILTNNHDITPAFIKCLNERKNIIVIAFDKDSYKHNLHPLDWHFYIIKPKGNLPIEGINLNDYPKIVLPPMVDDELFHPINKDPLLECDLGCYGPQSDLVYSLCYPVGELSIKIFGDEPWNVPQYMGRITHEERLALYNSAVACFANTIEEALSITVSGGLCLSNNEYVAQLLGSNVMAQNSSELKTKITQFTHNIRGITRNELINSCLNTVIPDLTYKHRLQKLMENL